MSEDCWTTTVYRSDGSTVTTQGTLTVGQVREMIPVSEWAHVVMTGRVRAEG